MKTTQIYEDAVSNPAPGRNAVNDADKSAVNDQSEVDRRLLFTKIRALLDWAAQQ